MPIPVKGHRAVVMDSVILIIGGFSDSLNLPVNFIQEYNPQTNSWRMVGNTKLKRMNFFAGKFKDSLFIFGGINRSQNIYDYFSLEVWKKNNLSYILRYNPVFNRIFSTGFFNNNELYIVGGRKIPVHYIDTSRFYSLVEYNVINDSISFVIEKFPGTPEIPFHQAICKLKSFAYIFGGVSTGLLNRIYRFNLIDKSLTRVPINLLQPRAGSEAIELDSSRILIIGGYNEYFKALKTTEIFTVNDNSFSIQYGPNLKYPRKDFAAVRYKNSIYVFGGENQSEETVPYVEKLDLVTDVEIEPVIVKEFSLDQNYPNPFNPSTTISFKIPQKSKVFLEILDIFGKRIKTLIDTELDNGEYKIIWDGADENNNRVASGIYFYRLSSGNISITKKMVLLR
jgi:archaellin